MRALDISCFIDVDSVCRSAFVHIDGRYGFAKPICRAWGLNKTVRKAGAE